MIESAYEPDSTAEASAEVVARLLGLHVTAVQPIAGGGNNKLCRVDTRAGETIVVKHYFRQPSDNRDRLGTEFNGLDFLWRNGVRRIPCPRACDRERGIGIYDYVPGVTASNAAISDGDIRQAVRFLGRLKELTKFFEAESLPEAAEAGFSLDLLIDILHHRLDRLQAVEPSLPLQKELCMFRDERLAPALECIAQSARSRRAADGYASETQLRPDRRILSSSDFGFHNAVRKPDGELIFVDFEYFGWDDPAKTISDFLLHPAMVLEPARSEAFVQASLDAFGDDDLANRLRAYFPLFGLKWTMIVLNEFLPGGWKRRLFSGADAETEEAYLRRQLAKAETFLDSATEADKEFLHGA